MVTGHSLGGGIALVVGALTDRLAVALQPPGSGGSPDAKEVELTKVDP